MFTAAYDAVDKILTAVAFVVFIVAMFSHELSHILELKWAGASRWWSIAPLIVLLLWRMITANYDLFENQVERVAALKLELDNLRQAGPQVYASAMVDFGPPDTPLTLTNRGTHVAHNITIQIEGLSEIVSFETIDHLGVNNQVELLPKINTVLSPFLVSKTMLPTLGKIWIEKMEQGREPIDLLKFPLTITYTDSGFKSRFQSLCELLYYPEVERRHAHRVFSDTHRTHDDILKITHQEFKRLV
jgi:hypothetical protein